MHYVKKVYPLRTLSKHEIGLSELIFYYHILRGIDNFFAFKVQYEVAFLIFFGISVTESLNLIVFMILESVFDITKSIRELKFSFWSNYIYLLLIYPKKIRLKRKIAHLLIIRYRHRHLNFRQSDYTRRKNSVSRLAKLILLYFFNHQLILSSWKIRFDNCELFLPLLLLFFLLDLFAINKIFTRYVKSSLLRHHQQSLLLNQVQLEYLL